MEHQETSLGTGAMFDPLARRYDLLNRLMSFGNDSRWRRRTASRLHLYPGARVLDLATGTADLAIDVAQRHPEIRIVGLDPSSGMLEQAQTKLSKRGLSDRIELREGVAEEIPFPDRHFDAITMAFGIRNCKDRDQALREMLRVVKPGGRIAILELGEPRAGLFSPFARLHVHHVIPFVGGLLSGRREYRYLQESIAAFPAADDFVEQMRRCGHEVVELEQLTFGSCQLYVSRRPELEDGRAC
jgi:demethylmenaquinone methyltransferase/2-methoxy-6-polyprenyl-1,4-benzoquinol methylase